jgi:PAS domain S-box-containing protein
MTVLRFDLTRPFTGEELELLTAFAAHAAVALENAHLYGQIEAQADRLEEEVDARTRALAMSEARYRALVETSLAGIFQADLDGRIVYANQALSEMIGMPMEQLTEWIHPDSGAERVGGDPMGLEAMRARLRGERPTREVYDRFGDIRRSPRADLVCGQSDRGRGGQSPGRDRLGAGHL